MLDDVHVMDCELPTVQFSPPTGAVTLTAHVDIVKLLPLMAETVPAVVITLILAVVVAAPVTVQVCGLAPTAAPGMMVFHVVPPSRERSILTFPVTSAEAQLML